MNHNCHASLGKTILILFSAAILCVLYPRPCHGETLTLREGEGGYDGFSYMQATSGPIRYSSNMELIFFGQMGPGNHNLAHGFFNFDLSPLAKVARDKRIQIDSVTLTLYKTVGPHVETTLDLRLVGDGTKEYQFSEQGDHVENWIHAPKEEGGTLGVLLSQASNPTDKDIDLTFHSSPDFIAAVSDALKGDAILRVVGLWEGAGPDRPDSKPPGERMTCFKGAGADEPAHRPILTIKYTVNP